MVNGTIRQRPFHDGGPRGRRSSAGPRRSKAAAEAILEAAEAVLGEAGYAGFTIEQVARRAGAGKPTIYRWWSGKPALLIEIYARQPLDLSGTNTGSLQGDLVAALGRLLAFWRDTPAGEAFTALLVEAQHDPAALDMLRAFVAERSFSLADLFNRAARRGELAPDFALAAGLDLVSGYVWARLLTRRLEDDADSLASAARLMARGCLHR
ncbi:TetR/AcrR family transcriptional regulator [Ancylobacter vacuolatus]|uniref:TetR/AcrR family transcriptional regulator n=1 Tax=Ancylobacter vacuolatus TaxID=223389 RepID=UPI0027D7FE7D|nr:TetR/AcrR family transcriptional regulator [Ancylobacter vacuolatus]